MSHSDHNVSSRQHPVILRRDDQAESHGQAPDELRHELAGLLDGSLRHVHLAIGRLSDAKTDAPLEHLEAAHDALHHMARLLHEWQSPLADSEATLTGETIGQAARQSVRLVHPLARQQGVVLTLELADGAAVLPAGPLRRVLDNALRNSLEAIEADTERTDQPPAITVTARLEASALVLTVSDNGPGLADAVLDEAGQFQFGQSSKGEQRGLGLPLAQRLVEQLGGRVTLNNRTPHGATLEVRCEVAALND